MESNEVALRDGFSALDNLQLETLKTLMEECSTTRCIDCPVLKAGHCELGKELPKYNSEQKCPVPIIQAKSRIYGIEIIDENIIMKRLQDIFKIMQKWAEDPRDCKYMMDCLMKIKEEYFPTVKKNLNINMDVQVKDQFMKFYDEVKNEAQNTNQVRRQINVKQSIDSTGQGHAISKEQD